MNQMISQVDANVAQKYFKVINHGWYVAHFEVQYNLSDEVHKVQSGVFSLGMEKKMFIPETATNVTITISVAVGVNWTVVETKFSNTMETTCFALYGTLFKPYALEVDCSAPPDLGNGNPTNPNQPSCCCCCCCKCPGMPQQSSMNEYVKYLNEFYQQQNE